MGVKVEPYRTTRLCSRGGTAAGWGGGDHPAGLAAMRCQVGRASGRAHGAARALDRGQRVCARGDVGDHILVRVRVRVRGRVGAEP